MDDIKILSKKDGSNHVIINGEVKVKLCRCGQSKVKPLCDGTHKEVGWCAEEHETVISKSETPSNQV